MDFSAVEAMLKQAVRAVVEDEGRALAQLRRAPAPLADRAAAGLVARQVGSLLPTGWEAVCASARAASDRRPPEPPEPDVVVRRSGEADGEARALLAIGVSALLPSRGAAECAAAWRTLAAFAEGGHQHGVLLALGVDHRRGVQPVWQWAASGAAAADVAPVRVLGEHELASALAGPVPVPVRPQPA